MFEKWSNDFGILHAISKLDYKQDNIVTVDGLERKVRIFEKQSSYKKIFTAFEKDFQDFISSGKKGNEPMFWNENRHCGGNLFRRDQFDTVGGYHNGFTVWGCEDSDLQWKFSEKYGIRFFPDELEVIHLDHPKGYFSSEAWARNEELFAKRKEIGIDKIIRMDKGG